MNQLERAATLFLHGFVGWLLCGATMAGALAISSLQAALIIHASAVPLIFGLVATFYFKRFRFSPPFRTALAFVAIVVILDVLVVAMMIEKSFEMFTSLLGTWIPVFLIGVTTYGVGRKQVG